MKRGDQHEDEPATGQEQASEKHPATPPIQPLKRLDRLCISELRSEMGNLRPNFQGPLRRILPALLPRRFEGQAKLLTRLQKILKRLVVFEQSLADHASEPERAVPDRRSTR